jgi:hypothetical protein
MTTIATQLATKLVNETLKELYINVDHSFQDIIRVTYRYKDEPQEKDVSLTSAMEHDRTKPAEGEKIYGEVYAKLASSSPDKAKGPCNDSYVVELAVVNQPGGGWGRLLYYIAMHYAGENGLISDRVRSSSNAVATWNKLWNDSEIKKKLLDDFYDPKTPDEKDDCNLASSGKYSTEDSNKEKAKFSKSAHNWNYFLGGHRKETKGEYEELSDPNPERAKEYKEQKANKLNYTYISESREAISILADAGRLAYNGKFSPKKTTTISSINRPATPRPIEENHVFLYDILFGD